MYEAQLWYFAMEYLLPNAPFKGVFLCSTVTSQTSAHQWIKALTVARQISGPFAWPFVEMGATQDILEVFAVEDGYLFSLSVSSKPCHPQHPPLS